MFSLLHLYLISNSSVYLPGIGTMQFAQVPAKFDASHRQIFLSAQQLNWVPGNGDADQNKLIVFLAKRLDLPEEQASTLFQHFLDWMKDAVVAKKAVQWNNVGTFHQANDETILFVPATELEQYQPPVDAIVSGVRQHTNYSVLVGGEETTSLALEEHSGQKKSIRNYWWVWALAIGLVSAALIALKFFG